MGARLARVLLIWLHLYVSSCWTGVRRLGGTTAEAGACINHAIWLSGCCSAAAANRNVYHSGCWLGGKRPARFSETVRRCARARCQLGTSGCEAKEPHLSLPMSNSSRSWIGLVGRRTVIFLCKEWNGCRVERVQVYRRRGSLEIGCARGNQWPRAFQRLV